MLYAQASEFVEDRRPLAPAAVAKLVVRREDDTIVDVEYVLLFILESFYR